MFEGDMDQGELEIGQAAALIDRIMPAGEIIREIAEEYRLALNSLITNNEIAGTKNTRNNN